MFSKIFKKRKSIKNIKINNADDMIGVYVFIAIIIACVIFYPYVYWIINLEMSIVDNIMDTYSRDTYFDIKELKENYPTGLFEAILSPVFLLSFTLATIFFIPAGLFFKNFFYLMAMTFIMLVIFYICKYLWLSFNWIYKIIIIIIDLFKYHKKTN